VLQKLNVSVLLYMIQITRTSSIFPKYIPGQGCHSTQSVCQNMDYIGSWPHLQSLDLPDIDHRKVMLLIEQDVSDALVPLDGRRRSRGSPYAKYIMLVSTWYDQ